MASGQYIDSQASLFHSYKDGRKVPTYSTWWMSKDQKISVPYPGRGVCVDPRSGDATFGVGGPGPPAMDNEHQLNLDRGGEKT
jgi:hypothetical protein